MEEMQLEFTQEDVVTFIQMLLKKTGDKGIIPLMNKITSHCKSDEVAEFMLVVTSQKVVAEICERKIVGWIHRN